MKHVKESLEQFRTYQFFKLFEENKEDGLSTDKPILKDKEKEGLAIIDKITKNFEDFKKDAKGEIIKYKEFWEENKQTKKSFTENGDVYKMFDDDYVVGVLELPVETRSDGSIEGGMGATDESEEEIIEGKEVGTTSMNEDYSLLFYGFSAAAIMSILWNVVKKRLVLGDIKKRKFEQLEKFVNQFNKSLKGKIIDNTDEYQIIYEYNDNTITFYLDKINKTLLFNWDFSMPMFPYLKYSKDDSIELDLSNDEYIKVLNIFDKLKQQKFNESLTEAEGSDDEFGDLDLNLDLDSPETAITGPASAQTPEQTPTETPEPAAEPAPEVPAEVPDADLTSPQRYLVVYDLSGNEREEIFRCGSNNVVKAFNAFYNDTFKGSMKDIIAKYKQQKEVEKKEVEKTEKKKVETEKEKKVQKFLGKTNESLNEDIDLGASSMGNDFESWLDEVEEHLKEEYGLDDREVAVFTSIADDQLNDLFEQDTNPIDAATSVAENEDFWEEFHASKEEEFGDEELEDVDDELEDPTVVYDDEDELSDEDLDDFDEEEELEDEDLNDEDIDTLEDEDEINNLNIRNLNNKTNIQKFRDLEND